MGHERIDDWRFPLVRNMQHLCAAHTRELLMKDMIRARCSDGPEGNSSRVLPRVIVKPGHVVCWKVIPRAQNERDSVDASYDIEILGGRIRKRRIDLKQDCAWPDAADAQRVAVRL